jgi:hypothetical protein
LTRSSVERVQVDAAVFGHAVPAQRGGATGEFLPRDQVGMVPSSVVTMTSPGPTACSNRLSPGAYDTRLIDSVAFFVKTSSSASAPAKAAMSSSLLVGVGGLLHQLMSATVHGPVRGRQERPLGVEHL